MRRHLLRVMCAVLLAMLLSAGSTAVAKEKVVLKFMGWEASPLETESVKKGLAEFMRRNPDIVVEYTPVGGDYHAKLLTMIAGNAAPDVFFLSVRGYYAEFQKRGILLDLTDYFNKEYRLEDFVPSDRKKMVINGRIYGISSCIVVPQIFYNKDLFDKAGLPYPPADPEKAWTWDEFVEVAKKLTIREGGKTVQYGVFGFEGWDEGMLALTALIFSNGGEIFDPTFSKCVLDQPAAREVIQKVGELRSKYRVAPEGRFMKESGMSASQMLQTGKVAMVIDGSWALQELAQMNFRVGVGVLPVFKRAATTDEAHVHVVYKGTKYPEEAWRLVSFLSSEWYQLELVRSGLWLPNRMALYTP
ncbi:MAG: sugar ABC transporter substrate-binding protein, partial [Bacillota bacterium]